MFDCFPVSRTAVSIRLNRQISISAALITKAIEAGFLWARFVHMDIGTLNGFPEWLFKAFSLVEETHSSSGQHVSFSPIDVGSDFNAYIGSLPSRFQSP